MKIILPGGSGQVGTVLARKFHADGHEVVVLSRHTHEAPWRTVLWDTSTHGDWTREIDGADVVITPLFPALRSASGAVPGACPKKRFPSNPSEAVCFGSKQAALW